MSALYRAVAALAVCAVVACNPDCEWGPLARFEIERIVDAESGVSLAGSATAVAIREDGLELPIVVEQRPDGSFVSTSMESAEGTYTVRVIVPGYDEWERTVIIRDDCDDQTYTVRADLVRSE